ncbi:ADH-zinc-N domain-containing protein [Fusarium sp. Ph1]|nr:ADH-zinc-N domain-containing protein [Fusarium sp. Ph1]
MGSYSPTNRAVWLSSFDEPPTLIDLPIPDATAGTVVVRTLAAPIVPYTQLVHSGKLPQLNLSLPLVPNPNAVGRIHAVGPDAVRLKPGDLVYVDATIRGRDDPNVMIMMGHHGGEGSEGKKLMQGEWRDGSLQQYQRAPLENVYKLDEQKLLKQWGYSPAILQSIAHYSVAGGAIIEAADVKVAETVIIGPSSGSFGGLAVEVALTLGANAIALGRSEEKLIAMKEKLNNTRFSYVVMTGDNEIDTAAILAQTPNGAGADVVNDWTPGALKTAPFLAAAAGALKEKAESFLDLQIMGKWMCEKSTLNKLINMMESGNLKVGVESGTEVAIFSLEQHEEAIQHAAKNGAWRNYTVIAPNEE